jgi:hypothetical protein
MRGIPIYELPFAETVFGEAPDPEEREPDD